MTKVLRGEWAHPEEVATTACKMAEGIDDDAVRERALPKQVWLSPLRRISTDISAYISAYVSAQVGASKNFSGHRGSARGPIDNRDSLTRWVDELAADVAARLAQEASAEISPERSAHVALRIPPGSSCRAGRRPK